MADYRILVADDRLGEVGKHYERLFSGDPAFSWEPASRWSEYIRLLGNSFDAVLLDVNLDAWGKTLVEALGEVKRSCPVVLVSAKWDELQTHQRISEALSEAKHVDFIGTLYLNFLGSEGSEHFAASMRSQLQLAIAKSRHRGLLGLRENEPVRILHLSDPQYADPGQDQLAFIVEREIPRFILHDLEVPVHFVAITGDITFSGTLEQFAYAEKKIRTLLEAFMPSREDWRERVLLVPGNHDVNLRLAAANHVGYNFSRNELECNEILEDADQDEHTKPRNLRYALQAYRDFVWRLTGNPVVRDAEDLCWVNDSFLHLGLRFVLLNSAGTIACSAPNRAKVPTGALERMVASYAPNSRRPFSIALSHHGPAAKGSTDVESLENWSEVGKLIQDSGVRLLLHGHGHGRLVHKQSVKSEEHDDARGQLQTGQILRVMAPTTHLCGKLRAANERRGFNLITLFRHGGEVEKIEVDSYQLDEDEPHRVQSAPWKVRM